MYTIYTFAIFPSDHNLNDESFALGLLLAIINHKPIDGLDNEPVLLVFLATSKLFRKATIKKGATLLS